MTLPGAAGAAAATQLVFTVAPSSATAGSTFSVTVAAEDGTNTVDPTYAGTVHFTSSDPAAGLPADYTFVPATDQGVASFTVNLDTAGAQTITATDTATSSITGTSGSITVDPAGTSQLVVAAPATTTAGSTMSTTVTAADAFGNTTPGYTGTVHVTSTDGSAVLPADYTFQAADAGVKTFGSVVLDTAGAQTITATDTVDSSITGTSSSIAVSPAAASQLVIGAPGTTAPDTPFAVTVEAQDVYGNTATGYTGTIHFASSDGSATLPTDYSFTAADNGVHAFASGVTLQTAGNQTVSATDTATSSITGSATVTVSSVAPSKLVFSSPPTAATAGTAFPVTVVAEYANGDVDKNYTGTVSLGSSDSNAVLPASHTFTAGDGGSYTFSGVTLETVGAGTQDVTASDSNLQLTADTGAITVSPAATSTFAFTPQPIPTEVAGTAFPLTVTAVDQYGNPTPAYQGTVQFTSDDTGANLPANYTFTAGDAGAHTFTPNVAPGGVTLYQDGSTVTVTDTQTGTITATTAAISLAAPHVSLSGPASSVQIAKAGSVVDFSLDVSSSGQPLSIPSDITQAATSYGPGAYDLTCPSYVTCTLESNTLSGTSPFILPVKVTQNNDGYFDPTQISLTLDTPTTGDLALSGATADAGIISEVNPPPGLAISVGTPNSLTFPAGGKMLFPVTLSDNGGPVTAGAPITVNYTVACPLPAAVLSCSPSGSVVIPAGQSSVDIPVIMSAANPAAYFPALPVKVTVTSPVGPVGTQISITGTGEAVGTIASSVAPPVVSVTGPGTVSVPKQAGDHDYTVTLSPRSGASGPVEVAVPLVVTFSASGTPGYSTAAQPGVDYASPVVGADPVSCPAGTSCVIFEPGASGIDPTSLPIAVDFLSRSVHGPNRYFQVQLTGVNHGSLGSAHTAQTIISDTLSYGYWLVGTDGGVFTEGTAPYAGSAAGHPLAAPVVAITPTPSGRGYWLVSNDGGVFSYGDARFFGSMYGQKLASRIVGIAATPTGHGYWLVSGDGGVFAFGDARFFGSLAGIHLVGPIVGMEATRDGRGYYLVGSDGGVFAFGDATFHGSLPVYCGPCAASSPILGISVDLSGNGYWLAAQNGGVFAFGDARYFGSAFRPDSGKYYVAITSTLSGNGYWLLATDGSVVNFGGAPALGSVNARLNAPLENMAGD